MSKARKHEEVADTRHTPHADSLKSPPDLPDTSPLDRMRELTRRIVGVPKTELESQKRKR
jgi:hypothetical protein